jgi:hypothetical protein
MNIISSFSKSALDAHSLSTASFSSTTSVIDATAVTSSTSFSDGSSSSSSSNSGSSRNSSKNSNSSSVVRSSHQQSIFFADVISEHIGMFWLMHLRSLCALRGMKPSVLLGMMSTRLMMMMMMLIDISIDDVD